MASVLKQPKHERATAEGRPYLNGSGSSGEGIGG